MRSGAAWVLLAAAACTGASVKSGPRDAEPESQGGGDGASADSLSGARDASSEAGVVDAGGDADAACLTSGGGACNTVVACGPFVTVTTTPDPAPAPQGGAILDGTYVLTSYVEYGTSTAPPVQTYVSTMQFERMDGGAFLLQGISQQGPPPTLGSFSYIIEVTPPAGLTWTQTCPVFSASFSDQYTATPASLELFSPTATGIAGLLYARQ
jgi:hypothetical protein